MVSAAAAAAADAAARARNYPAQVRLLSHAALQRPLIDINDHFLAPQQIGHTHALETTALRVARRAALAALAGRQRALRAPQAQHRT